jgi:hypothetical protein
MLTASFETIYESPKYETVSTCGNLLRNYDTVNMTSYVHNDEHDVTRLFITYKKTASFLEDFNNVKATSGQHQVLWNLWHRTLRIRSLTSLLDEIGCVVSRVSRPRLTEKVQRQSQDIRPWKNKRNKSHIVVLIYFTEFKKIPIICYIIL